MKNTLIRFSPFQLYESTSFEEYLSDMSMKGWLIRKVDKNGFLTFRRDEARRRNFSVDIFSQAAVSDAPPQGKTADYIELCKGAGWEFLCGRGKMLIFASEDEHPVPIQTDEEQRRITIYREAWKRIGLWTLVVALYFVLLSFMLGDSSFGYSVSKYSQISVMFSSIFAVLGCLQFILDFAVFRIGAQAKAKAKSKTKAKDGGEIEYRGYCMRTRLWVRRILYVTCSIGIIAAYLSLYFESDIHVHPLIKALVLGLVFSLLIGLYLKVIRKQVKQIRTEYIALCIAFLYMSCFMMAYASNIIKRDFSGDDGSGITYDTGIQADKDAAASIADWFEFAGNEQQTFLAVYKTSKFQYRDMNTGDTVGYKYTIFSSSFTYILDQYIELARKADDLKLDLKLNDQWGADTVYVSTGDTWTRYLVRYEDTVIDLQTHGTLSEEQMKQIRERLYPEQ